MARKIQKMPWRTPFQSILLCIKKPISIHIKGLKKVDIAFFPYLRERYFTLSLGNVNSLYYRFVIGKIKGE